MNSTNGWQAKKGKMEDLDRSFDFNFWQDQDSTARFAAAWELARNYHVNVLGEDESQLRLQRSIAVLKQREG